MSEDRHINDLEERIAELTYNQNSITALSALSLVVSKLAVYLGITKLHFINVMSKAFDNAVSTRKPLN